MPVTVIVNMIVSPSTALAAASALVEADGSRESGSLTSTNIFIGVELAAAPITPG